MNGIVPFHIYLASGTHFYQEYLNKQETKTNYLGTVHSNECLETNLHRYQWSQKQIYTVNTEAPCKPTPPWQCHCSSRWQHWCWAPSVCGPRSHAACPATPQHLQPASPAVSAQHTCMWFQALFFTQYCEYMCVWIYLSKHIYSHISAFMQNMNIHRWQCECSVHTFTDAHVNTCIHRCLCEHIYMNIRLCEHHKLHSQTQVMNKYIQMPAAHHKHSNKLIYLHNIQF